MVPEILTIAALWCPQTQTINTSKHNWHRDDNKVMKQQEKKCQRNTNVITGSKICLAKFIKTDKATYHVVCGYAKPGTPYY